MTVSHRDPGGEASEDDPVLAALGVAGGRIGAALYEHDREGAGFAVASVRPFAGAAAAGIRSALARAELAERIVPRVAATGRAECMPDLPRSVGEGAAGPLGSAYLVCLAEPDPRAPVLALLSPEPGAFGPLERALADTLAQHSALARDRERRLDDQIRALVRGLEAIAREVEALGVGVRRGGLTLPPELVAGLRTLSPREREVLHGIVAGQRVTTLARELFISAHTVRNHLKSIFRKLGVGSQVELLERLGPYPRAATGFPGRARRRGAREPQAAPDAAPPSGGSAS